MTTYWFNRTLPLASARRCRVFVSLKSPRLKLPSRSASTEVMGPLRVCPILSAGALHKAEPTRRANSGPCSGRSPREHVSPSLIAIPRVHPDGYAETTIEALRPADRPWRASAVSSRCIYPNWRPNFRSTRKDRIFPHKTHNVIFSREAEPKCHPSRAFPQAAKRAFSMKVSC